jgi:two-component system chemotaxis sensor kinase CheA
LKALEVGDTPKRKGNWDGVERRTLGTVKDEDSESPSAAADASVRVRFDLLDRLMELVGELSLTRAQILRFNAEHKDAALNAASKRLGRITDDLQESVMKTRMQPIGVLWSNLPRVVRNLAISLGKGVQLVMNGAETEVDRTIIEAIKDPLMHLVRNSCGHGIESPEARMRAGKPPQGFLTLQAYLEGGYVNIEVGDDGAGIDAVQIKQKAIEKGLMKFEQADRLSDQDALDLIFEPGFSLAKTVTNLSGRGVGMDVVKSHIEKIGGIVNVVSRLGEGTIVKIRICQRSASMPWEHCLAERRSDRDPK